MRRAGMSRIHLNVDTHEYKIHPVEVDDNGRIGSTNLLTYKSQTMEYESGYDDGSLTISTSVDGPKLETAIEKRSYMMVAITAVLLSRGLDRVQAENKASSNYHKFALVNWALSVEFSLLVRTNQVIFRSLRTGTATLEYEQAMLVAKNSGIVMNNLQSIVTEINEVYNAFKTFKQYEE